MRRLWPYFALFGSGLCWGLGLPFGKLAMRETDAAHMILLRFAVAALGSLPFVIASAQGRRLLLRPSILIAGVCYALGFLIQFEGLAMSDVSVAALLVGLMPALIAVAAAATGERVGAGAWAGVIAATLGAVLIAGRPGPGTTLWGVVLCLASLPVFLGWLFATRAASKGADALKVSAASIFVAFVVLAILVTAMHGPPRLALSSAAWGGVVGQGVLSTIVATFCWQLGAAKVSTAAAGVFINVEPVVGAGLGVALFHDRPSWIAALGGVLVLAGSLAVVLLEHRSASGATAAQDACTPA